MAFDISTAKPITGGFDLSTAQPIQPIKDATQEQPWYEKLGSDFVRQAGLEARGLIGGVASTLDIPNALVAAGTKGINYVAGTNIPVINPSPMRQTYNQLFNAIGLPKPETPLERIGTAAIEGGVGAGGVAGVSRNVAGRLISPISRGVAETLAANPQLQVASGASGGASSETAKELGASPAMQAVAGLTGAIAPSVPGAIEGGMKSILGAGEKNAEIIASRAKTFEDAGVTAPSVGQITGSRTPQAIESALSKLPGGAGPMAKSAELQAGEIGQKATQIADSLSSITSPSIAGDIIEQGISGKEGFIPRFRAAQSSLYNKLDEYLPKQANVDISNTKRTLAEMNADIPNAPALSEWFKNAKIQGIEGAMKSDTAGVAGVPATGPVPSNILQESGLPFINPGSPAIAGIPPKTTLPYESIKKLRSLVGSELENPSIVSDVPRSKWKALYASLSQDLDNAATATNNPDAIKAMNRANSFTSAGYDRIETVLDKVIGKNKTAEQIYAAALNPHDMELGATKISSVLKSLNPTERDVVKSDFIRRLGLANAGQQNAVGDVFSPQTFLTNFNKISPQAKAILFSGRDGAVRDSLDQIAKASQFIKEGSKVFSNPSGTAPSQSLLAGITAAASALFSGHPIGAGLVVGGIGASNLTAKMMTNPTFTSWLAKSATLPTTAAPAALSSLVKSIENEPEDIKRDVNSYISTIQSGLNNRNKLTVEHAKTRQ